MMYFAFYLTVGFLLAVIPLMSSRFRQAIEDEPRMMKLDWIFIGIFLWPLVIMAYIYNWLVSL